MGVAGAIRAGAAYVEAFLDDNRLNRGLTPAASRLRSWSASLGRLGAATRGGPLPEPLAAIANFSFSPAGLVTGMLAAAKQWASSGAELAHLAEQAGTTAEEFSSLAYAARRSGVDTAGLATGLRKMQVTVMSAARGMPMATAALASMGASVQDLAGMRPEEQFRYLADRIATLQNPTEKAAAAVRIFGRAGTELLPLLNQGAAGIDRFEERARQLGLTTSNTSAQAALRFHRALSDLQDVLKKCVTVVGSALGPYLEQLTSRIITVAVKTRQWIADHKGLVLVLFKVAGAVVLAGAGFSLLGRILGMLAGGLTAVVAVFRGAAMLFGMAGTVLAGAWTAITTVVGVVVSVLSALLTPMGLVVAGAVALGAYFLYASGAIGGAVNWLSDVFGQLRDDALAAFGGIADALAAGDIALATKVLWTFLKMEWTAGINWVKKLWSDFKWYFLVTWNEASYAIAAKMIEAWGTMKRAWVNTVAFMRGIWNDFCTAAGNLWNRAQQSSGGALIAALNKVGVLSDEEAKWAKEDLNRGTEQKIAARTAAGEGKDAQIEAERQAEIDRVDRQQRDSLEALQQDKDAYTARQNREYDAALRTRQAEYDRARKEFQASRDEAAAQRAAMNQPDADGKSKKPFVPIDLENMPGGKTTTVGTFNAFAVAGLGLGGGVFQDIRRGIDKLVNIDEKVLRAVEDGGAWD